MYPAKLSPFCTAEGPKLYPESNKTKRRRRFCTVVPISPKSSKGSHCFLGTGISSDISAKIARKIEIEAAPEHSALMRTIKFSPVSVFMVIAVLLAVIGIKFLAVLYKSHVVASAYWVPAKAFTSFGKAIPKP